MTNASTTEAPVTNPDRLFIGGSWVRPSTGRLLDVIDSNTESVYFRVAEASEADMLRAIESARTAFDDGPWPGLSHAQRAEFLRGMAAALRDKSDAIADIWPREAGALHRFAELGAEDGAQLLDYYADLAEDFPWEVDIAPPWGGRGFIVREPVGVVGAIVPWNAPLKIALLKIAPALLAGCSIVLKAAPEAPGAPYVLAEAAQAAGLPPGVFNMVTADREVSEILVRDPRVDKIAFTGSTGAGRRIASLLGERIGRYTLELGGKSPAVILDDADVSSAAESIARSECILTGQVCASLTRVVVSRSRHDEMVDALAAAFSQVKVGNAFDPASEMGPLAMARQRDRVEHFIAQGIAEGAKLAVGGGRPAGLERGYFIEPTVFGNVDNSSTIAREEIFGPVLSVIPAVDEADAVRIANDTIFGLNASVFTQDADKARHVARQLRAGTVSHNGYRSSSAFGFGGFKQSGVGREGGRDGVLPYTESKTILLEG